MDTGIDYDHPDLGGCFGPGLPGGDRLGLRGRRLQRRPDLAGLQPHPRARPIPDDCNGHGTHVAGIVGANGAVTGVAPGVTFGAYRVFGCTGSTTADIMIAAMERAYADGMDVLNMSIGSAFQWPQYPTAVASDRLVNRGMVVVASIGNSGANGLYAAGAPGVGEQGHRRGVVRQHPRRAPRSHLPDDLDDRLCQGRRAPAGAHLGQPYPLARTGTPRTRRRRLRPVRRGQPDRQGALIRRGTCAFHIKALNAQNAGAAGVDLYNNVPDASAHGRRRPPDHHPGGGCLRQAEACS
jgi:minor extracellular serine protease Vpr